jgi:hypothetical protein
MVSGSANYEKEGKGMVTSLCIYRVKPGCEAAFKKLLAKHWPTLRRVGLAADVPSAVYAGSEGENEPIFVELLHWQDASGAETAHEVPDVMAVWEPMGKLCEGRAGRPAMEFPRVEPVEIHFEA